MTTRRSIEIIERKMPGAKIVEDVPAADTTRRVIPLAKQMSIQQLKARSALVGDSESAPPTQSSSRRSEMVKVKVGTGLTTDRKPKTYSVIVSGDEDEIVGSQG